jgi:hypothetical protein
MEANGDDLTRPRDIDFVVVFPDEEAANSFATHFRKLEYNVSVEFEGTVKELPWDVVVVKHMTPTHREISDFEDELEVLATPLGGRNDGWGCISSSPKAATLH